MPIDKSAWCVGRSGVGHAWSVGPVVVVKRGAAVTTVECAHEHTGYRRRIDNNDIFATEADALKAAIERNDPLVASEQERIDAMRADVDQMRWRLDVIGGGQ